jgi:DDE superfamily endonuclease
MISLPLRTPLAIRTQPKKHNRVIFARTECFTERRTKIDWAHCRRELVEIHYPKAEKIVLVMDNLNTHTPAALYEAFTPVEARRIAKKLEIHHTPKHGSWLNMAEIELSVLARQCLDRRIPDRESLAGEVGAWEAECNAAESSIDWRFTTEEARIKLKHLYPEIVEEPSYGPNLSRRNTRPLEQASRSRRTPQPLARERADPRSHNQGHRHGRRDEQFGDRRENIT